MIYARQNRKDRLTQSIMAENLGRMSDAELLRAVAKPYANGGPVGDVVSARLLSIAAMCEATERTCRMEYNEDWSGDELYPTEAYRCSECGHITQEGLPDYCPRCGAKVVDE